MFKLKNLNELGTTTLRRKALYIAEAGLQAIDTTFLVNKAIDIRSQNHIIVSGVPWRTDRKGKIYFVGVGKCATAAAVAVEKALGDRLSAGIVLDVCEPYLVSKRLRFFGCTHPFPSQKNVQASLEVADFLKKVTADDLIIFVISGGGSTLLCLPESKNCTEEQMIMKRLFAVGAAISEINTVRKHLSLLRGGQLARCAYPARSIALIFSDVPGNDIQYVASGPTVKEFDGDSQGPEIF
ncbi:MAG: glycerate-2-kinase family protein [Candidatus Taylorbacteria bacterium]|nr:glycerate-2-kinase family protein [Candidatus Taylorbacteria bacterium]